MLIKLRQGTVRLIRNYKDKVLLLYLIQEWVNRITKVI